MRTSGYTCIGRVDATEGKMGRGVSYPASSKYRATDTTSSCWSSAMASAGERSSSPSFMPIYHARTVLGESALHTSSHVSCAACRRRSYGAGGGCSSFAQDLIDSASAARVMLSGCTPRWVVT
jgi:hypothetical protein